MINKAVVHKKLSNISKDSYTLLGGYELLHEFKHLRMTISKPGFARKYFYKGQYVQKRIKRYRGYGIFINYLIGNIVEGQFLPEKGTNQRLLYGRGRIIYK